MNNEFKRILKKHLIRYPRMQAEDVYKLAYQYTFGPRHFCVNENEVYQNLRMEAEGLKRKSLDVIEVGNGFVRIGLLDNPVFLETIAEDFIKSIKLGPKNPINFEELLGEIKSCLCKLKIDFKVEDFTNLVNSLKEKGYPAISHSALYRKFYKPHYRLIRERL